MNQNAGKVRIEEIIRYHNCGTLIKSPDTVIPID
jgi:hypothetical protein